MAGRRRITELQLEVRPTNALQQSRFAVTAVQQRKNAAVKNRNKRGDNGHLDEVERSYRKHSLRRITATNTRVHSLTLK